MFYVLFKMFHGCHVQSVADPGFDLGEGVDFVNEGAGRKNH